MSRDMLARLARFGFWLSLVLLVTLGASALVLGNPQTVKQAATDSKLYESISRMLADASGSQFGPTAQPTIESAAANSLTPEGIQGSTEQFIDGTYSWLEGKEPKPKLDIDLSPLTGSFTTQITTAATEQLSKLPVCTSAQLQAIGTQSVDFLNMPCLPAGISPEAAAKETVAKLQADNPILQQQTLTTDSLPKNEQGQTVFDSASSVPTLYQLLQLSPWIFGALSLLTALLVFRMCNKPLRAGYMLSTAAMWAGLLVLAVVGLAHLAFSIFTQPGGSIASSLSGSVQEFILSFVRSIEGAVSRNVLLYAAILAVVGWILTVILRIAARRMQSSATDKALQPPSISPPASGGL